MLRRRPQGHGQLDLFALLETGAPATPPLAPPTGETVVELATPALTALATAQAKVLRPTRTAHADVLPVRIAEHVEAAWYAHHGGGDIAVPLSVVAALAMVSPRDADGPDLAGQFLALEPDELLSVLRDIWSYAWILHPYLIGTVALPLHKWLHENRQRHQQLARAVHAVAHAAVNAGQFALTGHADPSLRLHADLLGVVLTQLRTKQSRQPLGEFLTRPSAADLIAHMVLSDSADVEPGCWYYEPAAGTGSLIRAMAHRLIMLGYQPADFGWSMSEIQPIPAACAAVNAVVWGLGANVLVHVGDTLRAGDTHERALRQRDEALAHFADTKSEASRIAMIHHADAVLSDAVAA